MIAQVQAVAYVERKCLVTRPIKAQFDDKLLRQLQYIVSAVSGNEFLINTMEQILPIFFFNVNQHTSS